MLCLDLDIYHFKFCFSASEKLLIFLFQDYRNLVCKVWHYLHFAVNFKSLIDFFNNNMDIRCLDNPFCLFQVKNTRQRLHTRHQTMPRETEFQLQKTVRQKVLDSDHHPTPSSQPGPVAPL